MIISHDNGYNGHNQVLLVEPGEWVSPSQIIAETGTSGGQPCQQPISRSGLRDNPLTRYFGALLIPPHVRKAKLLKSIKTHLIE